MKSFHSLQFETLQVLTKYKDEYFKEEICFFKSNLKMRICSRHNYSITWIAPAISGKNDLFYPNKDGFPNGK